MEYTLLKNKIPELGQEVIIAIRNGNRFDHYLATYEGGPYFDAEGRLFPKHVVVAWMPLLKYKEVEE